MNLLCVDCRKLKIADDIWRSDVFKGPCSRCGEVGYHYQRKKSRKGTDPDQRSSRKKCMRGLAYVKKKIGHQ